MCEMYLLYSTIYLTSQTRMFWTALKKVIYRLPSPSLLTMKFNFFHSMQTPSSPIYTKSVDASEDHSMSRMSTTCAAAHPEPTQLYIFIWAPALRDSIKRRGTGLRLSVLGGRSMTEVQGMRYVHTWGRWCFAFGFAGAGKEEVGGRAVGENSRHCFRRRLLE